MLRRDILYGMGRTPPARYTRRNEVLSLTDSPC